MDRSRKDWKIFLIGTVLNLADVTGLNITSLIVAVIGAVVVVAVFRTLSNRSAST